MSFLSNSKTFAGPSYVNEYPDTVIGYPDENVSSFDTTGSSNWVGYTSAYDGLFINEWDVLGTTDEPGPNGAEPGNLTSDLGRTVPTTWNGLRSNAHRNGDSNHSPERGGFGLFVVGRDCPSSVSEIGVVAYGGGGDSSSYSNYAAGTFSVEDGDVFRVVVGNHGDDNYKGACGCGGSAPDGDGNGRFGGAGTGVFAVDITRSTPSQNRFLVTGGAGNGNNSVKTLTTDPPAGDGLYGPQYGTEGSSGNVGGGPGAGGNDYSSGNQGDDFNTGTGATSHESSSTNLSIGDFGRGGGTGGNGCKPGSQPTGGAGGFAYNRVGLSGGSGVFGGGGGFNGGGGGGGSNGSAATSRVIGGNNNLATVNEGAAPGESINTGTTPSGLGFPYSGEFGRGHPNGKQDGYALIWW